MTVTNFQQIEQRYTDVNRDIVAALNHELQRLGCSFFKVKLSPNLRQGNLLHADDPKDESMLIDDWLIDLIETLRNLVSEPPLPDEMSRDDKNMWVLERVVEG